MQKGKFINYKRGMINDTYKDNIVWAFLSAIFESIILIAKRTKNLKNSEAMLRLKETAKNLNDGLFTESDANNDWIKHSRKIRQHVLCDNVNLFLRWPAVRDTMNVTNSTFIWEELKYLKKLHSWKSFWKKLIIEPWIGGQIPFLFYPTSSGNSIHLAYVMSIFIEKTNRSFKNFDFIFEFGGGYGNLCRLIHGVGFNGKYIMYDFPIVSALQKFYLSSSGLEVCYPKEECSKNGIYCMDDIVDLMKYFNETIPSDKSKNLFIATWSLSESSMGIRKNFEEILEKFDYFLIGYQDKFGEINNRDYFKRIKKTRGDIEWHDWPISYLPAHNFLIGEKSVRLANFK